MKELLFTVLRNKDTNRGDFRAAAQRLARLLAAEAAGHLAKQKVGVMTPVGKTEGVALKNDTVLVPILRSGLVLLPAFEEVFPQAGVGFVGLVRDEVTAEPSEYYRKLPKIPKGADVIVLDPMIATGGSGVAALQMLLEAGVKQEQILFVAVISAPEGVQAVRDTFPNIHLLIAQEDAGLTKDKFIEPGLGDFGDRYFGTEG